jgi:peptide chain release factor subunit 1
MLNRAELKEIAAMSSKDGYFVSLYLNVSPLANPKGDYLIRFKNMLKELPNRLDKKVLKAIKGDLKAIEDYFVGNQRQLKHGLCLISSRAEGFFREFHLGVPVRSQVVVERTPYIKPLLDILDNYQRYLVLLVARDAARIFVVHLGECVEYGELKSPGVPGKHKKGGWYALRQDHNARHVDYHVGLHLKDVAERIEEFLQAEYIGRVLVGGPPETLSMALEVLPQGVKDRLVGTFHAGMYEGPAEILRRTEPLLREFELQKERQDCQELITRARKNTKAVTGPDDVLQAIQEGRVQKLLMAENWQEEGFQCRACGALQLQGETCRYCGGQVEQVKEMADLMAQKAVEQGALIEVVRQSELLQDAQGVGAFLRF